MSAAPGGGAVYLGEERTRFRVWAPLRPRIDLHIIAPRERTVSLEPDGRGHHQAVVAGASPGTRYLYRIESGLERPDPASRFQPLGVHGPSEVVDPAFPWTDGAWSGLPWPDYTLYEIHVGAFTSEGTFDAVVPHLDRLRSLGITAIELMPVAQFPGSRNWGYDGVYPYAVHESYGGPAGLKRLVDACHLRGLAIVLDVVYNHVGPEGNYLADFGPYFTERYHTPWGLALNFDGPFSDDVRSYFIHNALAWVTDFHIDALRLDAIHAIADESAVTFLEELAGAVHERGEELHRRVYVTAESAANDARLVRSRELGGYAMDAVWSDDFHHAVHTLLVGEQTGYYGDYHGLPDLARAFSEGFVQAGRYSPFRKHRYGSSSRDIPAPRFVVFSQNHDQVGNRLMGERLISLASFEAARVAAGLSLLSPFVPLLFMGEEYGETAPFQYFVSHSDPALVEAVRKGRKEEFAAFGWEREPPDPQDEATFLHSKLQHSLQRTERGVALSGLYSELLRLRRECPALRHLDKNASRVLALASPPALLVKRWHAGTSVLAIWHFGKSPATIRVPRDFLADEDAGLPLDSGDSGSWRKCLDSEEARWRGGGRLVPGKLDGRGEAALEMGPLAFAVFTKGRA